MSTSSTSIVYGSCIPMAENRQTGGPAQAGWEEAAMNTLRHGASLTLYQKLQWLEEIEEVFLSLQRSSGSRGASRASPPLAVAEDEPADPNGAPGI